VLREEGVDLTRVVMGHSGDSTDIDYLRALADEGSILGMDRFGIDTILPTGERVDTLVKLCEAGYTDRMVLAQDANCYIDWFPNNEALAHVLPHWNYRHISQDVLPALRERGVSDAQINTMLVDNPRRYFENIGAY
jgi:phosphotriesterase-related protein